MAAHPATRAACAADDPAAASALLDGAVVECVYSFARGFESYERLMTVVKETFAAMRVDKLAVGASLAHF